MESQTEEITAWSCAIVFLFLSKQLKEVQQGFKDMTFNASFTDTWQVGYRNIMSVKLDDKNKIWW